VFAFSTYVPGIRQVALVIARFIFTTLCTSNLDLDSIHINIYFYMFAVTLSWFYLKLTNKMKSTALFFNTVLTLQSWIE